MRLLWVQVLSPAPNFTSHYKVLDRVSCVWHIPGTSHGGVPEWSKGTDCKSVGQAFEGSNPSPSTTLFLYVVREISRAGIAQLVEHQPSKLRVASSSLVSRSILLVPWQFLRSPGLSRDFQKGLYQGTYLVYRGCFLYRDRVAHVAQLVERILGKDEVTGSNPVVGSMGKIQTLSNFFF